MTDTYNVTNPDKPTIVKDPDAVLDYTFDWTDYLADIGDTILDASVILASGIALDTAGHGPNGFTFTSQKVIVWISGGTVGSKYQVTCRITTTGGRIDDRSIYLKIKER